jgi:DNA-directed RNA polymerase specialized sigma24 family protein
MRVICRNRMIRFLKQRPTSGVPLEIAEVVVPETEAKPFDAAVVGGLRDCLDRLETRQRQIIEWRYLHNHGLADIAGMISKNANTTAVYIHRLRKKLLACLRSQGFTA